MTAPLDGFTATLRGLGDPDTLAQEEHTPAALPRLNAHVHLPPNFTAFETTQQALELAAAQDVRVLGASNYYDYTVYEEFAAQAVPRGVFPLFGLEVISLLDPLVQAGVKINDPGNPGKMYLCGKGITRFSPLTGRARDLLQVIRDSDSARMAAVTDTLAAVFRDAGIAVTLDADAIKQQVAARHGCPVGTVYLQERHIAQAFQEAVFAAVPQSDRAERLAQVYGGPPKAQPGDAVATQDEIRARLLKAGKPAYVPDTFVGFDHAYGLVLALGGIPSYPTLADGATPITEYESSPDALVADLKARGIHAAEFIPNRNAPDVLTRYVRTLRDAGLIVTAGTEHNTRDLLPLAPTCVGGAPIPDEVQEIFWEGACVVAAHQYLGLLGRPGFVDADGAPNAAYQSAEERIEAFRRLGAALLTRYGEAHAAP